VNKPGQGNSDTRSYDRPVPPDSAGKPSPAARADYPATSVLPGRLAEDGRAPDSATARERPGCTDPITVAPAPQAPIPLTPPETPAPSPVVGRAPGAFRAGDQVDHFEIVGLVGQGGMGCVYKALDRDLGRTVAIKTLHGIDQHQPQSLARFRREAQAASRVVHPNLVIIYSSGTFGDTPYIVMEYLSGRSLAAEIAEGPIAVERATDILVAACAGVYAAHRADVVHRDLKPANIFLARTPMGETPKILDFGISRIGDDNSSLTGTGDVVGTTYYLAPEQAAGREVDARADQYALGVILYECLTGVRPFTGAAVYTIMRNIVEGIFQPPSHLRPEIPLDLEAAVLRAMSRVPGDRFARVRDFGLALVPFMSAQGRQQWSHHFTAPEAEMPIAPSLVVPVPAGANVRPIPTEIAPAEPPVPAPTKILPHDQPTPWQAVPTHTTPTASEASEPAPATPETRRRVVVLATGVVALLVLAVWLLWRPAVRNAERPSSSTATAVEATPPPATPVVPVVPVATIPEPSPTRAAPSRTARNKITAKIGKRKEVGEPSDKSKSSPKPGADHAPRTGKW
jgi:eukaryotic-like serine/threonine-protein kinase